MESNDIYVFFIQPSSHFRLKKLKTIEYNLDSLIISTQMDSVNRWMRYNLEIMMPYITNFLIVLACYQNLVTK